MNRPPSVDSVLRGLRDLPFPRTLITREVRAAMEEIRNGTLAPDGIEAVVKQRLERLARPSFRRVINATGVILHTNLGRAPLGDSDPVLGYSNLEYDLDFGTRGKRDRHLDRWIERLTGRPGIAVNNNAAAVYLVLHELAAGQEVLVSRGELIEIGDGFRIPEIMARSGAVLKEVGATNRTSIEDYRQAIGERTRMILRVHPSNFRITGFTSKPPLAELCALGQDSGIPVFEDLGSGCVTDLREHGIDEPLVHDSFTAGANLVSFSCDKLLGGPQTGIVAGDAELVRRVRRNPMYRAFRCDKLVIGALEPALRRLALEKFDDVPALWMIRRSSAEIKARAIDMAEGLDAEVIPGESVIGGGATPEQSIPTWLVALNGDAVAHERRLRLHDPPIIARIEGGRLLIDLRTVFREEEETLRKALAV